MYSIPDENNQPLFFKIKFRYKYGGCGVSFKRENIFHTKEECIAACINFKEEEDKSDKESDESQHKWLNKLIFQLLYWK